MKSSTKVMPAAAALGNIHPGLLSAVDELRSFVDKFLKQKSDHNGFEEAIRRNRELLDLPAYFAIQNYSVMARLP
jgi:hypothetical protein